MADVADGFCPDCRHLWSIHRDGRCGYAYLTPSEMAALRPGQPFCSCTATPDTERAPASEEGELVATYVFDFGTGEMTITPVDERAPAAGAQEPVAELVRDIIRGAMAEYVESALFDPPATRATQRILDLMRAAPSPQVAEPSGVERGAMWDGRSAQVGATLRNGDTLPSATVPVTQAVGEEDEAWLDSEASRLALEAQRHLHYERGGEGWFTARGVMLNNEAGRLRRILARLRAGRVATPASEATR